MNYEIEKTYSNENGQEVTIIGKLGNRYAICYGNWLGDTIYSSNISFVTQSYLDNLQLHLGKYYRNNCRCGYKSETPFGAFCPSCKESALFYHAKERFSNLPPVEDLLLGSGEDKT